MQKKYLTDICFAEFFSGKGAKNMNSMFGPETKFFKVTNQIGNILLVSVFVADRMYSGHYDRNIDDRDVLCDGKSRAL